jgi:CheY-like chemotaxis protein
MADVLFVDDNDESREVFEATFRLEGIDVASLPSGAEALVWLHENQPKVIVIDLAMPVLDGLKAVKEIRRNERLLESPPAIIAFFTGQNIDETIERIAKENSVVMIFRKATDSWEVVVEQIKKWLAD